MIDVFDNDIIGFFPKYTPYGDSVVVLIQDKKPQELQMSMRSFLKNMYFIFNTDQKALKARFKKIGIYQNAPIILRSQIYIKFKCRKPIARSDGAYGYLYIDAINTIESAEDGTIIHLFDGQNVKSLDRYETFSKNFMKIDSINWIEFFNMQ